MTWEFYKDLFEHNALMLSAEVAFSLWTDSQEYIYQYQCVPQLSLMFKPGKRTLGDYNW